MILLALLGSALAACEQTSDNAALDRGVNAAIQAFTAMEDADFTSARKAVLAAVPCLSEPLKPEVAAAVHRIRGLNAFLADDSLTAQLYFAAARSIDPSYRFPESVAPEGHPLQQDYLALDTSADRTESLPELREGSYFVNGRRTRERSTSYPALFQLVDAQDRVVSTAFLSAGADLPVDAALFASKTPAPAPNPQPTSPEKTRRRGPSVPLLIGAGVLGAAAGGLVVGNRLSYRGYNNHYAGLDATSSQDDLDRYDRLRGTTNLLAFTAAGAGVAAVGVGVTAFVVNGRF